VKKKCGTICNFFCYFSISKNHIIEKLQAKYEHQVKKIFLFSVVSTPSCLTNPLFLLWKMKPSIQPPQAAYNQGRNFGTAPSNPSRGLFRNLISAQQRQIPIIPISRPLISMQPGLQHATRLTQQAAGGRAANGVAFTLYFCSAAWNERRESAEIKQGLPWRRGCHLKIALGCAL
jgi:hypothetical protein